MMASRTYNITLSDSTVVEVAFDVDLPDKDAGITKPEHYYDFESAGLTEDQVAEVDAIINRNINDWVDTIVEEECDDAFDEDEDDYMCDEYFD